MELLPPEIKEHIFGFLDAFILQKVIPQVSQEWERLGRSILKERIAKMQTFFDTNPHYLEDIKKQLLHEGEHAENGGKILCLYEKAFLSNKYKIHSKHLKNVTLDFLLGVHTSRGCDCQRQNLCIIRSLHFMECHQLILVQMPEKIQFYSMNCIQKDYIGSTEAYTTSVLGSNTVINVWIDNNTHTAVSVYNDKIVSQQTTRALILFRVSQVNHTLKTVELENIRRIFLPLWSCDILMLKDKVCTLFTTGSIGVWHMEEGSHHLASSIQVSQNTCVDVLTMRNMQLSKMYGYNNLVLVKILTDESVHWAVFDSNDSNDSNEEFQLYQIDFTALASTNFLYTSEETCCRVIDVVLKTNCFILHCQVLPPRKHVGNKRSKSPLLTSHKVLCRRVVSPLTLDSFTSVERFEKLFDAKSDVVGIDTDSSEYFTMAFFPQVNGENEQVEVVRFIGVNDFPVYRNKSKKCDSMYGKLNKFNAVLYSVINS